MLLTDTIKHSFETIYDENLSYRQTGIVLSNLATKTQYGLFEDSVKISKITHLYKAVDRLNKRFGRNSLHLAAGSISNNINHKQKMRVPFLEVEV